MLESHEPVIVEALRTPIGRRGKSLANVRPDDLGAQLVREVVARMGIPAEEIGDVVVGCGTPSGEQGWNLGRQVALLADLPPSVPGITINRMCASSDQAVRYATQAVRCGEYDLALAVGIESMSRVPMTSDGVSFSPSMGHQLIMQGLSAELIAEKWGFSRRSMEELAIESHRRAAAAWENGSFEAEVVPVEMDDLSGQPVRLARDDGPRPDSTLETLAALPPAFRPDGRVTAATSSQMSDGASIVVVASQDKARELGLTPRARVLAGVTVGSDPVLQLTGVIDATRKALDKAGLTLADIDHFEVNEAFAVVPMAWMAETGVDDDKVNPRGGAMALGHPLGATGGRMIATMLNALEGDGGRLGLQTMCIGHGMANATIIERLDR